MCPDMSDHGQEFDALLYVSPLSGVNTADIDARHAARKPRVKKRQATSYNPSAQPCCPGKRCPLVEVGLNQWGVPMGAAFGGEGSTWLPAPPQAVPGTRRCGRRCSSEGVAGVSPQGRWGPAPRTDPLMVEKGEWPRRGLLCQRSPSTCKRVLLPG